MPDLRRTALIACIAMSASLVIPSQRAYAQSELFMEQQPHMRWLYPLVMAASVAFSLIFPVFLFALYRDHGSYVISNSSKTLGKIAAAVAVGGLVIRLVRWAPTLDFIVLFPLEFAADGLIPIVSTGAYVAFLLAFVRYESTTEEPASKFVVVAAKVAAIAWGLVVAGNIVRLAILPYAYSTARVQMALLPTPPTLMQFYGDPILLLLDFASIAVAPFVVCRSCRR